MKNNKMISVICLLGIFLLLTLFCWLKPHTAYSESERRELEKMPQFNVENILSGEFMKDFESYATDQFPFREGFRKLKAEFVDKLFLKKENNGLYTAEGHISKIEYPENPQMTEIAKEKFDYIYNEYLKDKKVNIYLSLIPDKNYFLAEKNGYLSIDYDKFIKEFKNSMDYMTYIDITSLLSIDDYYKTDSHWKQEEITDVAEFLAGNMGTDVKTEYNENILNNPFGGVYLGQSALSFEKDTIKYLSNDVIENAKVTYFDSGKGVSGDMYNMKKAYGKDPYEMFLSGTSALIEIENEKAKSDKELVLFRDSFGGSIAPLLVSGYKKITVVDIRYIRSDFLKNFITFENQDVLFLYSTTLINNSNSLR